MNVPMNMKCFPKDNLWLGNVINRLKESSPRIVSHLDPTPETYILLTQGWFAL